MESISPVVVLCIYVDSKFNEEFSDFYQISLRIVQTQKMEGSLPVFILRVDVDTPIDQIFDWFQTYNSGCAQTEPSFFFFTNLISIKFLNFARTPLYL